ncbi:uncharacterized protein LOC6537779 [Drosophila yakuba]|uniref:Uncharacterized protein n=1 Tax=Drosophila yakuba TaxID=7245 RepID=B4PMC7_DROYA|nr:uncharacterized protein LOC6537779 [Drosophila yakuba]EDW98032.1 uncharacterized protein Dyak_GE10318 [Drosophila yakuba]
MAFSTQKEFFHVPFSNETYEFECVDACVKLKRYPSTIDDRSWSANEDKKSQFVADLVACNSPIKKERDGEPTARTPLGPEDEYGSNLVVGDSLINAADDTIGRMQDLMIKNNMLQKKLADSDDKLRTANQETDEIKRIMDQRYDPDKSKALKKKIKQLADDNKITPQDEKELNNLQAAIDDMNKAHDILEAENANLKRLIEKQSKRCKMDSIPIDPEKSNDIPYLQKKIDDLGKELALLREFEDEVMKRCAKKCGAEGGGGGGAGPAARTQGSPGKGSFSPDKDAANIQKILADRDALRKKCKELEELGDKVNQLEEKANEAECLTCNLEDHLRKQCQCMEQLQCEMHDMQNYYENEVDKARGNEEILKCRCKQMKQELLAAKCAVQRAQCQQMEIDVLRNELRKRDTALNAYDCQFQQIMMKAKMFKAAGYRFLDDLPPDCTESCVDGPGEEEDGNEAP